MQTLIQDLRYSLRMLLKKPGFTFIAVVTLALGIGANTTIFSVINGMLLRPLPYKDPERIVHLDERSPKAGLETMGFSLPDFTDWRARSHSFEQMALYAEDSFTLGSGGGTARAERVEGANVTASLFPLLGVNAAQGRYFLEEEDKPGAASVVIIGYGLWQRRFGGDPEMIGREVRIDGKNVTIVGVMPAGFSFPIKAEVWRPIAKPLNEKERGHHFAYGIGRLKQSVTIDAARAELQEISAAIALEHPESNTDVGSVVMSWRDALLEEAGELLWLLLGSVGFVLLIACANVANLLLARGAARSGEMAIRAALGASRPRLMQQMLTESMLLALTGGALGLIIALWGAEWLMDMIPEAMPLWMKFSIDWNVLTFTLGATTATALLCGLAPGWQASKADLMSIMKGGVGGNTGLPGRQRLRSLLLIGEVALAMVLLIGAGLMIKSFLRVLQINTGFTSDHVMTARIALPESQYGEPTRRNNFYQQLLQRLAVMPGVESAAITSSLPLENDVSASGFYIEGKPQPQDSSQIPVAIYCAVSPGYFRTMGMRLIKGRGFTEADIESKDKVVIVDETIASRYFADQDPLGRRIKFGGANSSAPWKTIVGVVNAVRHAELKKDLRMQVYLPHQQTPRSNMAIVIRTPGDPASLTAALRNEVAALDKDLPLYAVRPMTEVVAIAMWDDKYVGVLFGLFAALALVLAAVGVYGVISYAVTLRTHEIGIRMALGAQSPEVLRLILRQGMMLVLLGVAIGLMGALLLARLIRSALFGVSASDPLTFAAIVLLMVFVGLLACYIPARRATKVDPMVALRYE